MKTSVGFSRCQGGETFVQPEETVLVKMQKPPTYFMSAFIILESGERHWSSFRRTPSGVDWNENAFYKIGGGLYANKSREGDARGERQTHTHTEELEITNY